MDSKLYKKIRSYLKKLIKGTPWQGKVYCVGGCCRDEVLGLPIKDIDLAVNLPDGGVHFAEWLHKRRLTVGRPIYFHRFGTARLRLRIAPDDEIELVQTRREQYTNRNSRNPETAFGSVAEDCERRDFTVNSLYYDISADKLLDITGKALPDIERHILRTPLDPDTTFDDDPVRILRGIRFAARFGWEIDPETYQAMKRNAARLKIVSPERMSSELQRILTGRDATGALRMLADVTAGYFPATDYYGRNPELWEHTLRVIDLLPQDNIALRIAALFQDAGMRRIKPKMMKGRKTWPRHDQEAIHIVKTMSRRLHLPKELTKEVMFYVGRHEDFATVKADTSNYSDRKLRNIVRLAGSTDRLRNLLTLVTANACADSDCDNQTPAVDASSSSDICTRYQELSEIILARAEKV